MSLTRFPRQYPLKSWGACNEMDTQEEECIGKVGQLEWSWYHEMLTQVDNYIQKAGKDPVIIPGGTSIFAMPC